MNAIKLYENDGLKTAFHENGLSILIA